MRFRRTPVPAPDRADEHMRDAVTEVRAELARADAKASMLLALSGAGIAVLASSELLTGSSAAHWVIRAGLALLVASVGVLLTTVRPKLAGGAPFMRAAEPGWVPETPRERMLNLSGVTRTKFARIRIAVDLLAAAVVVLAVGITWAGVA